MMMTDDMAAPTADPKRWSRKAFLATARACASRLTGLGAVASADRARMQIELVDFVEELGLTLDALTDASVSRRIDACPGRKDRIVVTLLARFPGAGMDRCSITTFGFGPHGLAMEGVDFGRDLDRLFEALTRRVTDELFPGGGHGLATSFAPAVASAPRSD